MIPDHNSVESTISCIFEVLFPLKQPHSNKEKNEKRSIIKDQLNLLISGLMGRREGIVGEFLESLDEIQELLFLDAEFILDSDPAATELNEVISIYPGFYAIFCYRIAHRLTSLSVPMLPRMITEQAHRITGIDIHPGAIIGNPFSIDHGTGIVIGETARLGNFIKMYQGVTIGALSVNKNKATKKRHPTIEDNVILYAGCTILGGETIVGRNSIVGGNVWLTESIAPDSVVYHKGEIIVKSQRDFGEPIDYVI